MGDELADLLVATLAPLGFELVEVELRSGTVRVVVDRTDGADLEAMAEATRAVSAMLDTHDPMPGRPYTLEVSSPGVERPLRTPPQFIRAVGETVTIRTTTGSKGERRVTGRVASADLDGFVLEGDDLPEDGRRFSYAEVERARTVFEWGGKPRPSDGRRHGSAQHRAVPSSLGADKEKVTTS
ncbi:MAG TPA: ribosome maturation factor RimP [Acidimicrobiales bacterium]|jgi:ribosome maturation factor RimP